jgi:hypothetical protein
MTNEPHCCALLAPFLDRHGLRRAAWDARLYSDLDERKTLSLVEDWESREQFERNLDMARRPGF